MRVPSVVGLSLAQDRWQGRATGKGRPCPLILWPWEPAHILHDCSWYTHPSGGSPAVPDIPRGLSHSSHTCVLCVHYRGYLHPWSRAYCLMIIGSPYVAFDHMLLAITTMVTPVISSCSLACRPRPRHCFALLLFLMLVTHFCGKVGEPRLSSHYCLLHPLVPPISSAPWPGPFIWKPGCIGRICQMFTDDPLQSVRIFTLLYPNRAYKCTPAASAYLFLRLCHHPSSLTTVTTQARL